MFKNLLKLILGVIASAFGQGWVNNFKEPSDEDVKGCVVYTPGETKFSWITWFTGKYRTSVEHCSDSRGGDVLETFSYTAFPICLFIAWFYPTFMFILPGWALLSSITTFALVVVSVFGIFAKFKAIPKSTYAIA